MNVQIIKSMEDIHTLEDNTIIGDYSFIDSEIQFSGKNNILIAPPSDGETKVKLLNTTIEFVSDNSVMFLSNSPRYYSIHAWLYNDVFCSIGTNNYFNQLLNLKCSDQTNIVIGDDCMFSMGIWLRTSDVHLMYDTKKHRRINYSKSILIGDHVWAGQDSKILKGTKIGSGAIIGADTLCAGKTIPSNTAWGGNPARLLRRDVFFHGKNTSAFTDEDTKKWRKYPKDSYIFEYKKHETIDFSDFEQHIQTMKSAQERAQFLLSFYSNPAKNRFYIN